MLPWLICAVLAVVAAVLLVRLRLLRKSLDDITDQLGDRLASDTNNPIFLSTRDPRARKLASELNVQLRELRTARQKYENGDRELREAVTNVSHDLRTPLTAVCGYLELLEREDLPESALRYLAQIENRAEAMRELAEELLRCSVAADRQEPVRERVDLRRCLEESLISFYAAMEQRGIVPEVSLPEGPVVRMLDPSSVGRIFGNIIGNALKYSAGDLSVTLDGSGTAVFSNSAPGLDPVSAGKLFDRFYTVETGRGSTGLGLSIARLLTQRMDGSIRAELREERLYITVAFPGKSDG